MYNVPTVSCFKCQTFKGQDLVLFSSVVPLIMPPVEDEDEDDDKGKGSK